MKPFMRNLRTSMQLMRGHAPGQLIIQMTNQCNARCPQCAMRVTESFGRSSLHMDDMRRSIDAAAARGVQALSFTGGEPMLMLEDMVALIRHAGAAGIPYIRTGTNGYLFKNPSAPGWKDRVQRLVDTLADTPLRNFWISVDSVVPEVHERMRGFAQLIAGIERALPIFHEAGLYPSANLGVNRNVGGAATWDLTPEQFASDAEYQEAFYQAMRTSLRSFYRFVRELGFTIANTCYPMSIEAPEEASGLQAVYAATSADRIVRFSRAERASIFRALYETVPEFRGELRVFSPLVALRTLHQSYVGLPGEAAYACRGGIDFFFINAADGNAYPCGYRGTDQLGKFWELKPESLEKSATCTECDWECFRDPSELAGPLIEGVTRPWALAARAWRDPEYFKLWRDDLRYYHACDYFNGRMAPSARKLRAFDPARADLLTRPKALGTATGSRP